MNIPILQMAILRQEEDLLLAHGHVVYKRLGQGLVSTLCDWKSYAPFPALDDFMSNGEINA